MVQYTLGGHDLPLLQYQASTVFPTISIVYFEVFYCIFRSFLLGSSVKCVDACHIRRISLTEEPLLKKYRLSLVDNNEFGKLPNNNACSNADI